MTPTINPIIKRGSCYVLLAFEVAQSINLTTAMEQFQHSSKRIQLKPKHKAPNYFGFSSSPLRVELSGSSIKVADFISDSFVEGVVFDFGSISVSYRFPLQGDLSSLQNLSEELYDHPELRKDARMRIEELVAQINPALTIPRIDELIEDYVIFEIYEIENKESLSELVDNNRSNIAGILRAERIALSNEEIRDATSPILEYSTEDALIVDWNCALIIDEDPSDVRSVLEFANVELLEMRFLDKKLDKALDESYVSLTNERRFNPLRLRNVQKDLRRIGRLQVDGAVLFEGVNNSLKMFGDQYLARVYKQAAKRFSLEDWDLSIIRKLETLQSVYNKLSDHVTQTRMEIMEFTIIILFIISILISL